MSIYISGMDMPTSCRACDLKMNCDDCEGWECVCVPLHQQIGYLDDLLSDKCRDDCPLVSVPEHGELIEREPILDVMRKERDRISETYGPNDEYVNCLNKYAISMVTSAKTIIPADKEGEG